MKTFTLAESYAELQTPTLRARPTARERSFLHLTLTIGPRPVPTLTGQSLAGGEAWTLTGWRAFRLFERLTGETVGPVVLDGLGMVRRAA